MVLSHNWYQWVTKKMTSCNLSTTIQIFQQTVLGNQQIESTVALDWPIELYICVIAVVFNCENKFTDL